MVEYIKRSDALKVLETMESVEDGLTAMHELPAADVVEVKHGWWAHDGFRWFCNRCSHNALADYDTGEEVSSKHCPNCGAKMEE